MTKSTVDLLTYHKLAILKLVMLGLCVAGLPLWTGDTAAGFALPTDDPGQARRWSVTPRALVGGGQRGLGGGLEYSVAGDFCDRLLPTLRSDPPPTCAQLRQIIQQSADRWGEGHPILRFVDVSAQLDAVAAVPPSGQAPPGKGVGAEIDLLALTVEEFPDLGSFGARYWRYFSTAQPMGTNGSAMPGRSITHVDIVLDTAACFYLDANQTIEGCRHFESIITQGFGFALGLGQIGAPGNVNFDTDDDPGNSMQINCNGLGAELRRSDNVDANAVMFFFTGMQPARTQFSADDIAGREFLYPTCAPPPTPPRMSP